MRDNKFHQDEIIYPSITIMSDRKAALCPWTIHLCFFAVIIIRVRGRVRKVGEGVGFALGLITLWLGHWPPCVIMWDIWQHATQVWNRLAVHMKAWTHAHTHSLTDNSHSKWKNITFMIFKHSYVLKDILFVLHMTDEESIHLGFFLNKEAWNLIFFYKI